jgi:hypothetical protein
MEMTKTMNVSAVSDLPNFMAQQATDLKGAQVQQAIQASVLKQTLDQDKAAGEAIVRMIKSTPGPKELGNLVDINI